jgi:hypothetical protein
MKHNWANSFLKGMGSINIWGFVSDRKYLYCKTDEEAYRHDCDAIKSDWNTVGNDLNKIITSK